MFVLPTSPRSVPGLVWVLRPLYCSKGHVFGVLYWVVLAYFVLLTPPAQWRVVVWVIGATQVA